MKSKRKSGNLAITLQVRDKLGQRDKNILGYRFMYRVLHSFVCTKLLVLARILFFSEELKHGSIIQPTE